MLTASLLTTPPPKQKPIAPSLPVESGRDFEPFGGGGEIRLHLGRIDLFEGSRALLVVARVAPDRCEPVGREGDEIGDRQAPRHIFDIRVQASVLVHDQDGGQFRSVGGAHEIALDRAVA